MKVRFTFGALFALMTALLVAFASPALAKNGKGGGGGDVVSNVLDSSPCATITSWNTSLRTNNLGPVVVVDVGVYNGCAQERADIQKTPRVSMTTTDTATAGRSCPAAAS
jgi:hypothetical protein